MKNSEILEKIEKAVEFAKEGKIKNAMEIYESLLEYEIPEVYNNIGNLYRREGFLGKAIEMYKKAIQIDQNFPLAYFNLGCALMELERYNEARMFLEKAEKLGIKGFEIDVQLALSYLAIGELAKAKERLKNEDVRREVSKYVEGGLNL
ncbi:MAG: tetratricopeptide repeat protein [Fervidobacterium sp.]|jgi:tetratricopeptide (TPR) repeat protein